MATKITTIYNALETLLGTALTGYIKMPDPYEVADNPELFLTKGYGIAVGPGVNTNRFTGCKKSFEREFTIILSNLVSTTETNADQREELEKSLLEDQYKIWNAIETDADLSGNTMLTVMLADGGIEYLEIGDDNPSKYILMEISVTAEYSEVLT